MQFKYRWWTSSKALNKSEKPIADKYREGKMIRTLRKELKVPEIVEREAFKTKV